MRNAIREAIEHPGFSFVDITSQCIENNGRRIGFASANDMLNFYRKTYKRAAKDAEHLNPFEIGILTPRPVDAASTNGDGAGVTSTPARPPALPAQPAGPMASAIDSPGAAAGTAVAQPATDDEKARRRAESQERAAVMAQLSAEVKLAVAKKELTLAEALTQAGIPLPEWLRTGASAPSGAPVAPGEVEISASGEDPRTQEQPTQLDAQKAEAAVEERNLIGGTPGDDTQPAAPRTAHDAAPPPVPRDSREARRAESQRKLALMQRLPSDMKLRVAKGEVTLADALREAGVDPEAIE
jgi:hypothetical protein